MSRARHALRPRREIAAFAAATALSLFMVPARGADIGVPFGIYSHGALDGITDVPGVLVGQVTKISGEGALRPGIGPVRTGLTVVLPNDDPWTKRVAAATYDLNGNGEMTGAHWINEGGVLETPVALTNTLNVGKVDDGVVGWMIKRHPQIGISDDVPLPVVAECDDQGFNDIQGRHIDARDVAAALDGASSAQFPRGDVGAGTGMHAFAFKGGIGSASRVLPRDLGGYAVGVLVNLNIGGKRGQLVIDGVPVGKILEHEYLPVAPKRAAAVPVRGRAANGSIIIVVATNALLDSRQLREIAKRAALGLARTGTNSFVSSGDLLIAFSTTHLVPRDGEGLAITVEQDESRVDALFSATAEATEAAVYDALFSARTMTGANGVTLYGLPVERVRALLKTRGLSRESP